MSEHILFDEEVIKNLKRIKEMIKDAKTRFDHVRGDVENREIMCDTIDRTIEMLEYYSKWSFIEEGIMQIDE